MKDSDYQFVFKCPKCFEPQRFNLTSSKWRGTRVTLHCKCGLRTSVEFNDDIKIHWQVRHEFYLGRSVVAVYGRIDIGEDSYDWKNLIPQNKYCDKEVEKLKCQGREVFQRTLKKLKITGKLI